MLITNILARDGKFYPVMSVHKSHVVVRDYKKCGLKYNDIEKRIKTSDVREVFINLKGGYWKPIHTHAI